MKKFFYILLFSLIGIAAFFYFSDPFSTFEKRYTDFAVKDTSAVFEIRLMDSKNTVTLSKKDKWVVQDVFPVKKAAIDYMFETLNYLEIQFPVPKVHEKEVIERMKKNGTKVSIRGKAWRDNSFYILQDTFLNLGSIIMKSGSDHPFVVQSPGTGIPVSAIFKVDELFWRDNTIFDIFPTRIASIKVIYPGDTSKSFSIKKDGQRLVVYNQGKPVSCQNDEHVKYYLGIFNNVRFEKYDKQLSSSRLDSLKNSNPFAIVEVLTNDNKNVKVVLHSKMNPGGQNEDFNRLYGFINDGEKAVVIKFIDIALILKKINYFTCE
ncbi:MAG: hypothetical protein ACOCUL_00195 [Bacteroidota bacterium]